jgi:site-specific DNA-methyltransferase (adenine-specific)
MENVILNDDCFNVMPKIADKSIDLVLVDLPYGQTSCAWDVPIDLTKMWWHLKRILKPNGQVIFFCTTKFGYKLIESNEKWFRYDLVMEKNIPVGYLSTKKLPMRAHEMIYVFHPQTKPKDLKWTYNPQMIQGKPYIHIKGLNNVLYNATTPRIASKSDGKRYPRSVIKVTNANHKTIHNTQKPLEIIEWLLNTYSNEGDLVLDFTAGSCTTAVGAINTKRRYICIEKDPEIYKKALERMC